MAEFNWFNFISFTAVFYVSCSFFFLKYPNFLHKKKIYKSKLLQNVLNSDKILHISHRGGSREALENTLDAFNNAVKIGSNMLEMDVCLTKDEEIVVLHDPTLERLCGINKHISLFNYEEIPPHLEKTFLHFSINQYFDTSKSKEKYMPKLEEVFQKFPNMLINVEIKEPSEISIKKTEELIKKYKREHLTIWGTRYIQNTQELLKKNNEIPVFFSMERILITYLYFITGLLPFVKIKENSMQIPLVTREFKTWKLSCETTFFGRISVKAWFASMSFLNFISLPLFQHLRKRGVLVFYWVLNDVHDYKRAIDSGITGIMTDSPSLLYDHLKSNQRLLSNSE